MKVLVLAIIFGIALADVIDINRYKREISNENDDITNEKHSSSVGSIGFVTAGYQVEESKQNQGKLIHVTLTKEVKIPHHIPVPVAIEQKIVHPIYVPNIVHVDKPYPVKIYKPYPVLIYKNVPYKVYKDVPIPVKVGVEVPYPIKVPVLIPQPYPIYIHETVTVPVVEKTYIKRPVILESYGNDDGFDGTDSNYGVGNPRNQVKNYDVDLNQYRASGGNYGSNGAQEVLAGSGQSESNIHEPETNSGARKDQASIENRSVTKTVNSNEAKN